MIAKRGDKYVILSKKGKQLGEYDSKEEATKRLKQIEYFKMKAKKKMYKEGGKVTKKMVDDADYKMKNELNSTAKEISETLKRGYRKVNGFPRPLSAAQKKSLEQEMVRIQKKLGKSPSYRDVGTSIPSGPAPMEDDAMFYRGGKMMKYMKGGKIMKYLKGGQVKLDANKDGKISGEDFMILRKK